MTLELLVKKVMDRHIEPLVGSFVLSHVMNATEKPISPHLRLM